MCHFKKSIPNLSKGVRHLLNALLLAYYWRKLMQPQVSNVTPIKPLTEDKSTPSGIFDMNETQFQALINRRSKNRLFFLNAIKTTLVDGVDFGVIPSARRSSTKPSLFKSGGEKVAVMLGLTPIFRMEQSDSTIIVHCELLDEQKRVAGYGCGGRDKQQDKSNGGINKSAKLAVKSSYLDAVIRAGALSDLFTLDLEDEVSPQPPATSNQAELISEAHYKVIVGLIDSHSVSKTRFLSWLSKFCLAKGFSNVKNVKDLPKSLVDEVVEKIPSFSNTI
jgi:hypothetical protein